MESTTTIKKKKRRTRKCLDEIRKRSRRTIGGEYFRQTFQQQRNSKIEEHQTHRLITKNRLTINMFHRAIRSETITRPLLQEIKQKSLLNCQDGDQRSSNCITLLKVSETQCLGQSNSAASKNSTPLFDLEDELQQGYDHRHKDHNSSMLASSRIDMIETPTKPLATIYTTSSPESSHEDHSHALYEELMKSISSHLYNITTNVIKEDIMMSTKISLQKLWNNTWNRSCNGSFTKEYSNIPQSPKEYSNIPQSPKGSILQNPLDYIRLKHVEQQGVYEYNSGLPMPGGSAGCLSPGETAASHLLQMSASHSPEPCACTTDTTYQTALYDTPEYNYYPHRLNE